VSRYIEEQGLWPNEAYWVGGSDEATSEWTWIDGSPIPEGVPFWGQDTESPLLPNNATLQRCLELWNEVRYRFDDYYCSKLNRPLCQATPLE
jgi:hypothetical protein